MVSYIPPICIYCKHRDASHIRVAAGWQCAAFPQGIPEPILHSAVLHTTPYSGDKGITFEVREGKEDDANWLINLIEENLRRAAQGGR